MLAFVLLRLARIYGDDELERLRRRRLPARRPGDLAARRRRSATRSARSISTSRRRGSSRSSARPTAQVARAALARFAPNTVVAVGPSDEVPLLARQGARRRRPAVYSASASPARRRSPRRRATFQRNAYEFLTIVLTARGRLPADGGVATRWTLTATLALLALSAALASAATSRDPADADEAEHRRPDDRRPDGRVHAGHAERPTRCSPRRESTFTNNFASFPLCCPSSVDLHHGPVRPQPQDHGERRAERRLRQARASTNTLPAWLRARATRPSTSAST